MGRAGTHKEKKDAKRQIKNKNKFKNKNSIGKTKNKKVGSAGRYLSRTQAVNKLQVPLKDFRRLCILKGVYPREPRKKFKGGNTTYYFAKDILFLMHEPLLDKFREQKAFLKKIRKAVGRHERLTAKRLDARRPTYKLDHLIRERYPSFPDALSDLDDALCLVMLFASLASSKIVPEKRVQQCAKLRREFLAYVARTHSLRRVFISIKGIYYQAEINGVTLTWVEPHAFAQQPTMEVDYRVMLSFLELYEAVLTFVNYKLYHDLKLAYPPPIDGKADAAGGHISAAVLAAAGAAAPPAPRYPKATPAALARLHALQPAKALSAAAKAAAAKAEAAAGLDEAEAEDETAADMDLAEHAALSPDADVLSTLFKGCVVYAGRETPVAAMELLVLSCGGAYAWEGEASPLGADSPTITHQIVDRPVYGDAAAAGPTRERVQPQWVFDCINARSLLPTHAYRPGAPCPAHLSPFGNGAEGYTPIDRVRQAAMDAARAEEVAEGDDSDEEEEGEEDEEEEGEGDDDSDSDDEEAARYKAELAAELGTGGAAPKRKKRGAEPKPTAEEKQTAEEKELAMGMMSRKKRRLYDRMQYGIEKKKAAAGVLAEKRKSLDKAAKKAKK